MTAGSYSCHRLPGGVYTIKQAIARPARRTSHLEAARRGFRPHIVHQAKVAVWRAIEFKHLLAAQSTVLSAAYNTHRFCHDDTNPAARCNFRAPNGVNSIPEMAKASVEGAGPRLITMDGLFSPKVADAE